mmetsp:Transcript_5166/g.12457  ORF Transcript_5166/g.12457 Transcript_5166/m.12457 type:complete len:294 (+) Transcript_5166:2258-3139(+)
MSRPRSLSCSLGFRPVLALRRGFQPSLLAREDVALGTEAVIEELPVVPSIKTMARAVVLVGRNTALAFVALRGLFFPPPHTPVGFQAAGKVASGNQGGCHLDFNFFFGGSRRSTVLRDFLRLFLFLCFLVRATLLVFQVRSRAVFAFEQGRDRHRVLRGSHQDRVGGEVPPRDGPGLVRFFVVVVGLQQRPGHRVRFEALVPCEEIAAAVAVVVVVVVVVAFVLCQRRRITLCVCVCVCDHVCARVCRRRACGVRADSKNKGVATRGTKHHQTSDLKKKERAQETRTRFHHNR